MESVCNHSFIIMDKEKKCMYCGVILNCECMFIYLSFIRDICNYCSERKLKGGIHGKL